MQRFADLIELTHQVLDLLFAEHELLAVADAVTESQLHSGFADAALGDAGSVVGFYIGGAEDSHSIDPLVGAWQVISRNRVDFRHVEEGQLSLRTQLCQLIWPYRQER